MAGLRAIAACISGDATALRGCLEAGLDVNTRDTRGDRWNLLQLGVMFNHPPVVAKLMSTADIDLSAVDREGWTVLHWACASGHAAIIPILGSSLVNQTDFNGETAMMVAISHGHLSCVQEMAKLEGIDWLTRGERGKGDEQMARYVWIIIEIGTTLLFTVIFIRKWRQPEILAFLRKRREEENITDQMDH